MNMQMPQRALLSVTNKTGIADFAYSLVYLGWEIISTGGTAKAIQEAGTRVTLVEEVTGFPEMMDGRLKTLHPKIFGGILADRTKPEHMQACAEHGITPIDLVCVNLYDFAGNPGIEQIDIGGPSLIRAAAKNSASVIVVVNPADYGSIADALADEGALRFGHRGELMQKAFHHTAAYDAMISDWALKHVAAKNGVEWMQPSSSAH